MTGASGVTLLVDDLFRRAAGEINAVLLRRLGGTELDIAEEAVQDAFAQALRVWPWKGVPQDPRGWLYRAAHRRALDTLLKQKRRDDLLAEAWGDGGRSDGGDAGAGSLPSAAEIADEELALLLLCCDSALPRLSQVTLTLKVACGFGVGEIAAAFLATPAAVAQRIVRAKASLREANARPPDVTRALLDQRAPVIREVLYLLFTGGHSAAEGGSPVRGELCGEALRLGRLVLEHSGDDDPTTRALLALFCLHAARLPARLDKAGVAVPLKEQARDVWDRSLLAEGFHHLERSAGGSEATRYHLEAGIAALHATATRPEDIDWSQIVVLYDRLLEQHPSAVVALNRAVALAEAAGPRAGLAAVMEVADAPALKRYHLLPAVLGDLHERLGDKALAQKYYSEALRLAPSRADRDFIERRLVKALPVANHRT